MNPFIKIARSTRIGVMGLAHAFMLDRSFRLEVLLGLPIYLLAGYVLAPLSPLEWLTFFGSYVFILIVELLNTSMEKMLDRLHPEKHELIEKSKDIASAAVLLSFLLAGIVVLTLFFAK